MSRIIQLQELMWAVRIAKTKEEFIKADQALTKFQDLIQAQSEIASLANHINELAEDEFLSPYEYSDSIDTYIDKLCNEFGL